LGRGCGRGWARGKGGQRNGAGAERGEKAAGVDDDGCSHAGEDVHTQQGVVREWRDHEERGHESGITDDEGDGHLAEHLQIAAVCYHQPLVDRVGG